MVRLDDQTISLRRHARLAERNDQVAPAGGVRRVDDHRKVREPLRHDYRREVQREARRRLERPYPPLAQDHVLPALFGYVLRRQQPLFDRRREAPLEDDAVVGPGDRRADALQEREVRHVARAYLDDLRVLHDELYILGVHDLGDGLEAELARDLGEYLQALLAQALEGVRGGAGLEGAAADILVSGLFDGLGRGDELVVALDGAGAGDNPERAGLYHTVLGRNVRLYARGALLRNTHKISYLNSSRWTSRSRIRCRMSSKISRIEVS